MINATRILQRHPENPIITPEDMPHVVAVFNPSPAVYRDKTILLLSAYEWGWPEIKRARGGWVATSNDGVHFDIAPKPLIDLIDAPAPFNRLNCTMIDARITPIDGAFYINSPVYQDGEGPFTLLGKTEDFQTYTPLEIVAGPVNRVPSVFPEKIGGKYYRLERPGHDAGASIWLSSSPDLIHWGNHTCIAHTRPGKWDAARVGAGCSPIKTDKGWLMIYHGATKQHRYCLAAILLDLNNPTKVIARSDAPLMEPTLKYETCGFFGEVIFTNGHIVDGDTVTMYYGAADEVICGAKMSIKEILKSLGV